MPKGHQVWVDFVSTILIAKGKGTPMGPPKFILKDGLILLQNAHSWAHQIGWDVVSSKVVLEPDRIPL